MDANRDKLIERLRTFPQPQLEEVYKNCFSTDAGQLVLEDLKARFWFYLPTPGIREDGQEDVIKHIRNMVNPMPKETDDGQHSGNQ